MNEEATFLNKLLNICRGKDPTLAANMLDIARNIILKKSAGDGVKPAAKTEAVA